VLALNVLLAFGAYGALFALFAAVIALAWFLLWRATRALARLIKRIDSE